MFAYCLNNPVIFTDDAGRMPDSRVCTCRYDDGGIAPPNPKRNYSHYDENDLFSEYENRYIDISEEDAARFYDKISRGDYGSVILLNPLSFVFGRFGDLGNYLSLIYDTASSLSNINSGGIYDPEGRLL